MAFYGTAPSVAFEDAILTLIGRSFRANLQGYTSGPVPFTLTRTGPNNWTATFSAPVLNAPPLVLPQCYVFSPSLEVRQIVPVLNGFGQATAINITTLEQGPFTYTLTIYGTESV